ncbi:HNH endonuclease [Elizabethkingia miricola]|uniref:HNH endonuclease n=1 Tax=Elizabethkingia miricola TaxID=172045 RepID=UPI0038929349
MAKREAIGKKLRFEVFKRDKFTCQYCGEKAPEVVLNVDHINPVANGGTNEILNLITSCFSCNSGKSDRILSDSSVVEKQRKQLELLEERREQIELMLEWKKSLSNFDNDVVDMIVDYINSKIQPLSLNENGIASVTKWLKKFEVEKILDAVDISAKQYLRYENGEIEKESAELFLKKIGGVIVVQNMTPVKQKLAYIKGIARNRFSYWDDRKGSIILSNYVTELEKHFNEDQLLEDLENEVSRITKTSESWSEWRGIIETWTSDIEKWEVKKEELPQNEESKSYSFEQLERFVSFNTYEQNDLIKAVKHVATIFPNFDALTFHKMLNKNLLEFLKFHNDTEHGETELDEAKDYIAEYIQTTETFKQFGFSDDNFEDFGTLIVLEPIINQLLIDIFMCNYYPAMNVKKENKDTMIELNISLLEKIIIDNRSTQ